MGNRSYLMQATTTARSLLHSCSRRCVQGDFTLGAMTRPISYPRSTTYTLDDNGGGGGVADFGGGSDIGVEFGGSGDMGRPGGSGGAARSSSEPPSTGINQQYLVLSNPFQDPELLESMRRQWQRLPNWKSATVRRFDPGKGRRKRYARKYVDLVGVSTHQPKKLVVGGLRYL